MKAGFVKMSALVMVCGGVVTAAIGLSGTEKTADAQPDLARAFPENQNGAGSCTPHDKSSDTATTFFVSCGGFF